MPEKAVTLFALWYRRFDACATLWMRDDSLSVCRGNSSAASGAGKMNVDQIEPRRWYRV